MHPKYEQIKHCHQNKTQLCYKSFGCSWSHCKQSGHNCSKFVSLDGSNFFLISLRSAWSKRWTTTRSVLSAGRPSPLWWVGQDRPEPAQANELPTSSWSVPCEDSSQRTTRRGRGFTWQRFRTSELRKRTIKVRQFEKSKVWSPLGSIHQRAEMAFRAETFGMK